VAGLSLCRRAATCAHLLGPMKSRSSTTVTGSALRIVSVLGLRSSRWRLPGACWRPLRLVTAVPRPNKRPSDHIPGCYNRGVGRGGRDGVLQVCVDCKKGGRTGERRRWQGSIHGGTLVLDAPAVEHGQRGRGRHGARPLRLSWLVAEAKFMPPLSGSVLSITLQCSGCSE
jgi:hypothetical protein